MNEPIIDQTFESYNFSGKKLPAREYDNCVFTNCDFTNTDISVVTFLECRFETCNFGSLMMKKTSFQEVTFIDCKMLGLDFSNCNDFLFSVQFDSCNLDYATFYNFQMKNTIFNDCSLKIVDFTETDLSGTAFNNCNLSEAVFSNTILQKADFRTAVNYTIDPESNNIKKAKFKVSGLLGLLTKYDLDIE
ncbi:pentapeptide repeat-containing protein [Aquimarina sp. 2201CG5-10]|uniref:pentapeptide repeat-containing protein n=1 Tax=Aquimarina callyspongiae TaxID=3098150 RepID=UPI002AB57C8B|nr:pentapeptide repeat-containing protein [Aquimarina sp. 2201CG5-10]MDY8135693.1 pentapeptide repeat-containing protein [Aquimarina sp. 2201CG5-10]